MTDAALPILTRRSVYLSAPDRFRAAARSARPAVKRAMVSDERCAACCRRSRPNVGRLRRGREECPHTFHFQWTARLIEMARNGQRHWTRWRVGGVGGEKARELSAIAFLEVINGADGRMHHDAPQAGAGRAAGSVLISCKKFQTTPVHGRRTAAKNP